MTVISFDDWKKKQKNPQAYTSAGTLREDVLLKEAYGFDLCSFIMDEINSGESDPSYTSALWQDLLSLTESLPKEHAYFYFKAFIAFREHEYEEFSQFFDTYLASEKELFQNMAPAEWWIEYFIWIFLPAYPGFFTTCANLFDKHWPLCSMSWLCRAIEQNECEDEQAESTLEYLTLAILSDPINPLAHYLMGAFYFEHKQWNNALLSFQKAGKSEIYYTDASFLFDCAWSAEKANNFSLSKQYYKACIECEENYPCALNNLGCLQMRLHEYKQAFETFSKAIQLQTDKSLACRNALNALKQQGKIDEALTFIEQYRSSLDGNIDAEIASLHQLMTTNKDLGATDPSSLSTFSSWSSIQMIANQLEKQSSLFGRSLLIYEDDDYYGCQLYLLGAGKIDILCVDQNTHDFYLFLLLDQFCDDKPIAKIQKQMITVHETLAKQDQHIYGVILCEHADPHMQEYLQQNSFDSIFIYRYGLSFSPI